MSEALVACPCATRTLEDQAGNIVWRATTMGQHCSNPAAPYVTASGEQRADGWCDDCIAKVCDHCRHD